jgi:predicted dienelactone hydrolase
MFGHSAGGFTALVVAGGEPDFGPGRERCQKRPQSWECRYLREHGLDLDKRSTTPQAAWLHDTRVKALVIAAPCCGWSFEPDGLSKVKVPIQLWAAEEDSIVEDSPATIARLLPEKPEVHKASKAGHLSFLAPWNWQLSALMTVMSWSGGLNICADQTGFDRRAFHKDFNAAVAAFFSKALTKGH